MIMKETDCLFIGNYAVYGVMLKILISGDIKVRSNSLKMKFCHSLERELRNIDIIIIIITIITIDVPGVTSKRSEKGQTTGQSH